MIKCFAGQIKISNLPKILASDLNVNHTNNKVVQRANGQLVEEIIKPISLLSLSTDLTYALNMIATGYSYFTAKILPPMMGMKPRMVPIG